MNNPWGSPQETVPTSVLPLPSPPPLVQNNPKPVDQSPGDDPWGNDISPEIIKGPSTLTSENDDISTTVRVEISSEKGGSVFKHVNFKVYSIEVSLKNG